MRKYITWGYLIIICTILPLYMKDGYYMLGESKGLLYLGVSAASALVLVLFERKKLLSGIDKESFAFFGLMAFLFSNIISFVFSINKSVSFFGLEGWRGGFLTVILMLFFTFVFSGQELFSKYITAALLLTPAFEFVLGILGRFGIYPIAIAHQNNSFVATIGNINWYVGFLSVFVSLGIGLCYTEKLFSKEFFLLALYEILGLVALFTQGSESGALVMIGAFLLLLFRSLGSRKSFLKMSVQLFILGLSMEIVDILMLAFGNLYNYQGNLLIQACSGFKGLILMASAFFLYRLSRLFEEISGKWRGKLFTEVLLFALGLGAAYAVYKLRSSFGYGFGNGRGLIWSISVDMFHTLSPWRKLVGVGQDGFYSYAYSVPEIADSLLNTFPGNKLTNAHCELLTMLIERGLLGVVTYLFFMGTILCAFIKNKKERAATICALPVIAYFLNSLVSFSTVTSTPYLMLAIGIGLSSCRNKIS